MHICLGFVLDRNAKHFPTLLIVCMLMSIVLYIVSNVVYLIHQRKTASDVRVPGTTASDRLPKGINEEEQEMASYLRDQEEK